LESRKYFACGAPAPHEVRHAVDLEANFNSGRISFEGVIYEALLPDTDGFHAFFIVGVVFVAQPPSQILQDRRLACTTTADESRVLRIQV
jgi:hypothetical protein